MRSSAALLCLLAIVLSACSDVEHADLREYMEGVDKNTPRKIEQLPQMRPYEPFEYTGFDVPDPFKPRKLSPSRTDGARQPDLGRRKEPLESFPLESLKMVGTLQQGPEKFALVRADASVYRVKKGNYLGQNFGQVIDIGESEVKLKEVVQDAAGDWTERVSALTLLDESAKK